MRKVNPFNNKNIRCQVSGVTCQMSPVKCHKSPVTRHMSPTPTATTTDPLPTNSPIIYSRIVCKDQRFTYFLQGNLKTSLSKKFNFWDHFIFIPLNKESFCNQYFWTMTFENGSGKTFEKYTQYFFPRTLRLIDWISLGAYTVKILCILDFFGIGASIRTHWEI